MKRFDYSAFFRPREEGESSPPLRKSERGNYAHATSFRLMTGINCVGGMEGGGRPTRIFCPPLPSLPTTHSTLINSDVHRPPRPPARPSFQPRKCKGIRDLAAKGSSQMGEAIAFLAAQKILESWDDDDDDDGESKGCELRTWIASILQILATARFAGGRDVSH